MLYLAWSLPLMFLPGSGHAENTTPVPAGYTWGHGDYTPGQYVPPANNAPNNSQQPQQPSGPSAAQIAAQQQADEEAAQRAAAERKRQEAAQQAADQAKFQADKATALANLKGISSADSLQLKSIGSGNSLGLKGIDDSSAFSGLKGLDDSGLKDAVADKSSDKRLFENKNAIQSALDTSAYGKAGINQLASYLPGAGVNPELGSALDRAKAEINKVFDAGAPDVGHFDSVVLKGNSQTSQSVDQTLQVPDALKRNPNFKKLIIERDALNHQDQEIQKQIQSIKADPVYAQDGKRLTKLDQLQSAQNGVRGMAGRLNKLAADVVQNKVNIDAVDFSESAPPKKGLDNGFVPPPAK